jgi:hypothetical protein
VIVDCAAVQFSHLPCEVGSVVIVAVRSPIVNICTAYSGVTETLRARGKASNRLGSGTGELGLVVIARRAVVLLRGGKTSRLAELVNMLGGRVIDTRCSVSCAHPLIFYSGRFCFNFIYSFKVTQSINKN